MTTNTTASIESPARGRWADWAGMIASIGCAVHCAAMPLVLAYLPTLGLGWLASDGFHKWMALICFALAAAAFVPGWRKHRSFRPAIWGGLGLLLLATAAFGFEESCCATCASNDQVATPSVHAECSSCQAVELESPSVASSIALFVPYMTPLGGLLLVVGHVVNHRTSCKCQGDACCLTGEDTIRL